MTNGFRGDKYLYWWVKWPKLDFEHHENPGADRF